MLSFEFVLLYLVIGFFYARAMVRLGDPDDIDAPLPDFFIFSRMNIDTGDDFSDNMAAGFLIIAWPLMVTIDLLPLLFLYIPGKIIHNR